MNAAVIYRDMYLKHCDDCLAAGMVAPSIEVWIDMIDQTLHQVVASPPADPSDGDAPDD